MSQSIVDIDVGVVPRIKDEAAVLTQAERYACIASAVAEYQQARPRDLVTALVGTGAYEYDVSAFTGWVDDLSRVLSVHGPVLGSVAPPRLPRESWILTRTPSGERLRFLDRLPSSVDTYHVRHTGRHTLDDNESTIWLADDEALMDLSAHYCCLSLSGRYSQETSGSISADTVDHRQKADMYRSLAASYRKTYETKLPKPVSSPGYLEMRRA